MAQKTKRSNPETMPADGNDWTEIDLHELLATKSPAPVFPVNALPEKFRGVVTSVATARCINADLIASTMLATASGAIGNRVRLQLTPSRAEPLNLFVVLVAEPGEGKSEAISISRAVFNSIERPTNETVPSADPVAIEVERKRNISARRTIAHDDGMIVEDATRRHDPRPRRLVLTDFTVAGIRDALVERPEGGMALADELVGVMGVGSGSDSVRARAILLAAHDGNPYRFVKAREEEVEVPALQLTILGATQPDRVNLLVGKAVDGMVPRFLWCAPDVKRIDEMAESDGDLPLFITAAKRLSSIKPARLPDTFAVMLSISPEAREAFRAANERWNNRTASASALAKTLLARGRTQALRLAGVMALTERALSGDDLPGGALSGEEAERGVTLVEQYFLSSGERVAGELLHRARETPAMQLARYLVGLGEEQVNARDDVRRGVGSPLRDADVIATAFEELRLRGYVRDVPHTGPGRPAKLYRVNPHLLNRK